MAALHPVAFNAVDRFVVTIGDTLIVTTRTGEVFGHDLSARRIGPAFKFAGAKAAFNEVDRFVVTIGNTLIVTTRTGEVFGHEVSGRNVGPAFKFTGAKAAFNEVDRFVVTIGNTLIVTTRTGEVFGHEVSGRNVGPAFKFTGAKAAFNEVDRFVVTIGNTLIVTTQNGDAFGHEVSGRNIGPAFKFTGAKAAFNEVDRFVVTIGNMLIVTTQNGDAFGHEVSGRNIGPAFQLNPLDVSHFTFAADISTENRNRLIDRHKTALMSVMACNPLVASEKDKLYEAYRRPIHHTTLNKAGVNASATIGGSTLNVNFGVLFPQGDEEISQTLIHEMMHCAGFSHPVRRDPPAGQSCANPDPALFDCPNDNGQYYGTPPLRAEFCIAGDQSDVLMRLESKADNESCVIDEDGVATLHTRVDAEA